MALLGRSGSGKSTSLALIEGALVPDSGKVMLNGLETAAVQEQISSAVAVLNQKPHLFNTSIMNNIRLGNGKASDEDVKRAARQVKLHDYIESLPDGYETSVQETGIRFSGGERQRIALARILLQDTLRSLSLMNRRSALMRSLNANCLIRFLMSLKRKRSSGLHTI